jgi:tetratricopeptide (TPR) repeat protein
VPRYQANAAMAYVNLGHALQSNDRFAEARKSYDHAIAVAAQGMSSSPEDSDFAFALAQAYGSRGHVSLHEAQVPEAAADLKEAIRHMNKAIELTPHAPQYSLFIGNYYHELGEAQLKLGQREQARQTWREQVQRWEQFLKANPTNTGFKDRVAEKLVDKAMAQGRAGMVEDQRASWRRALELGAEVILAKPDDLAFRSKLASHSLLLARQALWLKQPELALAVMREATKLQQFVCDKGPKSPANQRFLANCHLTLAMAQGRLHQSAEALDSLRLARAELEKQAWWKLLRGSGSTCAPSRA